MFIKWPLDYAGNKYKLLPQIMPLISTKQFNTVYDLFCGSLTFGINTHGITSKLIGNDKVGFMPELFNHFKNNSIESILGYIDSIKAEMDLQNREQYYIFRKEINDKKRTFILDKFILAVHSFHGWYKENKRGVITSGAGVHHQWFNLVKRDNLVKFVTRLQNKEENLFKTDFSCEFFNKDFDQFDIKEGALYYLDPPYFITETHYNRYWKDEDEKRLYKYIERINSEGGYFALSNVIEYKDKINLYLKDFVEKNNFKLHFLDARYFQHVHNKKQHEKLFNIKEILLMNY